MNVPAPKYCRPAAHNLFVAQLPRLETAEGLLGAAVAIASHEMNIVEPQAINEWIKSLAGRARRRVRTGSREALLAHLHGVLFEEEGLAGNVDDYYNPRNSYVPAVLETKLGIPISLTLIYKCVAQRLELSVQGINAPGHFLARVEMEGAWTLVDPFSGGRILSPEEAVRQIEQTIGRPLSLEESETKPHSGLHESLFQPATHRDWIARMIRNLREIFAQTGREDDQRAMQELFRLL